MITSPSLDYPAPIPLKRKKNLSARDIESILNSNEDFRIDSRLKIYVIHSQIPEGRDRKPPTLYKNKDDAINNKRGIMRIIYAVEIQRLSNK